MRSIVGFNREAAKGKDAAQKYCRSWQMELTTASAGLVSDLTQKRINQQIYNIKRADLNKQTQDLNKCIALLNQIR